MVKVRYGFACIISPTSMTNRESGMSAAYLKKAAAISFCFGISVWEFKFAATSPGFMSIWTHSLFRIFIDMKPGKVIADFDPP